MRKNASTEHAGARRRAHFASGGDVARWRGRARRFPDARKQASKQACRGRFDGASG